MTDGPAIAVHGRDGDCPVVVRRGALDALRNGYRDFFAVAKEFPADPEAAPVALKRRLGAAGIRLHAAGRDLLRAVRRHGVRSDALRDALTFFEED